MFVAINQLRVGDREMREMDRTRMTTEPAPSPPSGVRVTLGRNLLALATWAMVIGVVLQVYLAGISVFRGGARVDWELHRNVGYLLGMVALLLTILAFVVRANKLQRGLGILLVIQFVLQSVFVALRESPEIAALHTVNGMAIVLVTALFAMRTWRLGGLSDR